MAGSGGSSAPNPRVPAAAAAAAGGPAARAFVCRYCGEVWGSARSLANHTVMHTHPRPSRSLGVLQARPPVLDPAVVPPLMPPGLGFFLQPPALPPLMPPPGLGFFVQPPAMAPARPVVPEFPFGRLLLPPAPPLRFFGPEPVLPPPPSAGAGGNPVGMVPLDPNPAFWASYRNPGSGSSGTVEDNLLGQLDRPASPSPSFSDWLPREDDGSSVDIELAR